MQPKTAILREDDPPPSSSSPSFYAARNRSSRKPKSSSSKENAAPSDPNSLASPSLAAKSKSPLPPRPPNPLKRKLSMDTASDCSASGLSDSGVQVFHFYLILGGIFYFCVLLISVILLVKLLYFKHEFLFDFPFLCFFFIYTWGF